MVSQVRIADRRRKRTSASLIQLWLILASIGLFVLLVWSHDLVAKEQQHVPAQITTKAPLKRTNASPAILESTPAISTRRSIVEMTKLEQHPHPDATLLSKTGNVQQRVSSISQPPVTYPPIDTVVSGKYNVTGDISFLVDFAILGFPKCGTSTMMEYLDQSPYTKVAQKERCELGTGRQAKLVRDLYAELPEGNYKRGIKCPRDLENEFAMANYQKYFPKANVLVGVRHPVRWFESFYNFRVYNNNPMPPAEELVGVCGKYSRHVCTHRARFHQFLANLGKTPLDQEELNMFALRGRELRVKPIQGKLFLYHVEQLRDDEPPLRQLALRKDLSEFLGLPEILPPIKVWRRPGKNLTQEQWDDANRRRLDICHSNHTHIRNFLIEQSKGTAEWMLQYLLKSNDVYISSPGHFRDLLKAWEVDPCTHETPK